METLKRLMRMKGIPAWKIADQIGVSEMTVYRWLRKYDKVHYDQIMGAIQALSPDPGTDQKGKSGCVI